MFRVIKTIFLTLLFIVGITFSMENTETLVLSYFGFETPPIPLFLLVLCAILLGVFLSGMGFIVDVRSLKKSLREKEREIASLEEEINPLRERNRSLVEGETRES